MKVLYIATSFPKKDQGSTIYTDLAEELVKNGHDVTVVISSERKNTKKTHWNNERGCKILRVKTGNIYDVNLIEKGLTMISLGIFMKRAIRKYLNESEFDLVLYEAPPVTNCEIVKFAKNKFNAKSYLMLKDIFPQNAVDIGIMKKNSFLYKFFKMKEKKLYDISDMIGCMSLGNKNYLLKENNISEKKIEIFPNTKKIKSQNEINSSKDLRKKYNIPEKSVVFLFGGNMGKPQGVENLCNSIIKLKENEGIFFVLVGRGTEKNKIKKMIEEENCKNVVIIDNLPRNEYEQLLIQSDVGLVLLDEKFTIPNYPSRILSYMEYSKPVIAATDEVTDFKDLILNADCGLWNKASDINKFCDNIINIAENEELRRRKGESGRIYMEKHFDVIESVKILERFTKIN